MSLLGLDAVAFSFFLLNLPPCVLNPRAHLVRIAEAPQSYLLTFSYSLSFNEFIRFPIWWFFFFLLNLPPCVLNPRAQSLTTSVRTIWRTILLLLFLTLLATLSSLLGIGYGVSGLACVRFEGNGGEQSSGNAAF